MPSFNIAVPWGKRTDLSRRKAAFYVFASVASLIVGAWVYGLGAPLSSAKIIAIELGGSGQKWPLDGKTSASVWWDVVLIAGYGAALWFAMLLAHCVFWSRRAKAIARGATALAFVAVFADVTEDAFLLVAKSTKTKGLLDGATAASVVKFSSLVPAAGVGITALSVTIWRLWINHGKRVTDRKPLGLIATFPVTADDPSPSEHRPTHVRLSGADRWRRGYLVPECPDNADASAGGGPLGICLSGGGVRSASVALGALQSLREDLKKARYLVSVSGGGYTAGAMQLAMTEAGDADSRYAGAALHDPDQVFIPGSVEEDWFRRHADYLADSPAKIVVALGVIARVLLLSITFLFGPAIILGVFVGRALKRVPLAEWNFDTLHTWVSRRAHTGTVRPTYPAARTGTVYVLALLGALAVFVYFGALALPRLRRGLRRAATGLTALALLVALIAIGIPSIVFGAAWVLSSRSATSSGAVGGGIATVVLSYGTTLAALLKNKKVKDNAGGLFKRGGTVGAAPAGAVQLTLVVVTLLALAAAWLLLFGAMAAIADRPNVVTIALVGGLVFGLFAIVLDQTSLSLHPFYRRRLAGAFATRRVLRPDGQTVAEGYDYSEVTTLSTYGARPEVDGKPQTFPEVIFAATANLTGEERAPLNGVPYTLSAKWVGGPDIGYVGTAGLEQQLHKQGATNVELDLTVEAAVAISGAAVASAMGRSSRWYGTLLAVTGVRLGTWLPNPVFLGHWNDAIQDDRWTLPGIPNARRLSYLVREVLGIHQFADRLLQVTDGGHYENLGLVELLRRRCRAIYCIDSSGDSPPTATTLEQAVTIARAELGVTIRFKDTIWGLVPSSGPALEPDEAFASLNARLAHDAVVVVDFTYPEESGLDPGERDGILIFAKTVLTRDLEYDLLSYAASSAVFPRDSTGDQFFDDGKFCAYRALGQELGTRANSVAASLAEMAP